jgi:hypothetical protein
MKPIRVQRKRTKGYRLPDNTVSVCRPGKFGNPFKPAGTAHEAKQRCVDEFRAWLVGNTDGFDKARATMLSSLESLRGKNLACFCKLDEPCHADVLLELANA